MEIHDFHKEINKYSNRQRQRICQLRHIHHGKCPPRKGTNQHDPQRHTTKHNRNELFKWLHEGLAGYQIATQSIDETYYLCQYDRI